MSIKFTANEIRYIALFENMTGAMVKDCIIDDEHGKVTFVVKNGDMGLAIGKGGSTVSKVQRAVDKGLKSLNYPTIRFNLLKIFYPLQKYKVLKYFRKNQVKK